MVEIEFTHVFGLLGSNFQECFAFDNIELSAGIKKITCLQQAVRLATECVCVFFTTSFALYSWFIAENLWERWAADWSLDIFNRVGFFTSGNFLPVKIGAVSFLSFSFFVIGNDLWRRENSWNHNQQNKTETYCSNEAKCNDEVLHIGSSESSVINWWTLQSKLWLLYKILVEDFIEITWKTVDKFLCTRKCLKNFKWKTW
jgi:hypothetical protein